MHRDMPRESASSDHQGADTSSTYAQAVQDEPQEPVCFMSQSLFVLPESFDEDLFMEALPYLDNSEVIYVAGDMDDECILEEEEAMAILANYGQVRKYLHNTAKNG